MLPWNPSQKPKREIPECCANLWFCSTSAGSLCQPVLQPATLLQTFFKEERCETIISLSASQHSEWWFLLSFVTSQQQFILSCLLSEAWSEADVYFERWSSQNTCIIKACWFFFMEQQCYLTLAEILPTSRISLFDKHVNYCWLLLYNYRIQMLFIGLSAVSHSNPNV